jgi:SAM-dependent methyltransferase
MAERRRYSETRYLRAKRTVDDRALHRGVLEAFAADAGKPAPPPRRVLELGAGVGTMVSRLLAGGWLPGARYTLVDSDGDSLRAAAEQAQLGAGAGAGAGVSGSDGGGGAAAVDLVEADVFAFLEAARREPAFDAVIANAFLDLVDVRALLPILWRALRPGAPFWFSINFDGETVFLPELPLDAAVMPLYHLTMDERVRNGRRAGDSRTGRRLLAWLPESGAEVSAAGGSDWVVWPTAGRYPADEAYFLHHIVHTIDLALAAHPGRAPSELAAWVAARHVQIERGELVYIAHQLDVAGRAPS